MKFNRRSFVALTGVSALGATGLRAVAAQENPVSPYALGDGTTLTWSDPWASNGVSTVEPLVNSAILFSGQATLVVGYFSAPTAIDDWVNLELASNGTDVTKVPAVAGGSSSSFAPGAAAASTSEYRVHLDVADDGSQWGILYQVVDQLNQTMLYAPVAEFATFVASVQAAVALDGTPVLSDIDGAEIQADMEAANPGDNKPAIIGEYTDASGNLHVTWLEGWTIVSQNEVGVELTNQEQSVVLAVQIDVLEGRTWDEQVQVDSNWLIDDQGADGTLTTPVVTETGFSFSTNGDYGLRLAQGSAIENDPDHYILTFAHNMTVNGAEAQAILQQIQSDVTVNGEAPLQGLDAFIDMSAT